MSFFGGVRSCFVLHVCVLVALFPCACLLPCSCYFLLRVCVIVFSSFGSPPCYPIVRSRVLCLCINLFVVFFFFKLCSCFLCAGLVCSCLLWFLLMCSLLFAIVCYGLVLPLVSYALTLLTCFCVCLLFVCSLFLISVWCVLLVY